MRHVRAWLARLAGVFTGHRRDEDLRDELQAHLDLETAEYVRRGLSPNDARRRALMASGGLTIAAEAVRAQRGIPWLESIVSDLRYALKSLRHSPAFTAVVVITLALGIGANTAIFSVVRGVLLKPLPNRDGDRLLYLRQSIDGPAGQDIAFSVPEVRDFRAGVPALGGIAEFSPWALILQGDQYAPSARIQVGLVTGNFFDVMGLHAILGRLTKASDDGPGVPPVMVLTEQFWRSRFRGDPTIVGKQVHLEAGSATVIGVVQAAPYFPSQADALLNMVVSPHHLSATMVLGRTHRMTEIVGRLAPGATVDEARAQVGTVYARMQRDYKDSYDPGSHFRVSVLPFKDAIGERARLTLWLLMAAAAFVMIISTANVVNLTLMRGVRREQELVVRAALGAGVLRLRRLLLTENLVLAFLGAAAGIFIAVGGVKLLTIFAARFSPRADDIHLDTVVLSFTLVLTVGVALLLSFVASLPREGMFASWISAGTRRTGSLSRQRLQRALVVAQIAVSVVLLAGAGLLTRTMMQLSDVDTGLKTEQVLSMQLQLLPIAKVSSGADVREADAAAKQDYERIEQDAMAIPGVVGAGVGSVMPLEASEIQFDVKVEGKSLGVGEAMPRADYRTADPGYFHAAGIPLVEGRNFEATDRAGAGRVVIINQTLARRLFPHDDPIGKRIAWTGDVLRFTPISGDWRTVVGVVGNTQDGGLDALPRGAMFMPYAQELAIGGTVVIRADSNVSALTAQATSIARRIAPATPIEHLMTVAQIKDESVSPRRLNAVLITSFGMMAVVIAAVGIAGVLAFSVSARTNEIGIRMSLGADSARVQRMILGEGGVLLASGLALGVGGGFLVVGVMRGLLFGVAPHDPVTFVGVAALMALIGVVACWVPALRAARIDPAITMRAT